jgi:hypothetical protein
MARFVFTPVPTDVIADAQSVTQFKPVAIDLTAYTSPGDRLYSIDLPEGLEVMAKSHRILGAPTTTQSATTHNIYCQAASGPDFWIRIDLTVAAPGGRTVTTVTTDAQLFALTEFGGSYTGPGCVVELAAGVEITRSASTFNRFRGLTSPIVIKSADPNNRARIVGGFGYNGNTGTVGNISFVDIDFYSAQPGGGFATFGICGSGGTAPLENLAWIRCKFESDVEDGSTRIAPLKEMTGINITIPLNNYAVWDCRFTKLFNGVILGGNNGLIARNEQYRAWGDLARVSTSAGALTAQYILVCDNALYDTVSDGFARHGDGVQMGGGGASGDTFIKDFERRGDLSWNGGTYRELPAIPGTPWSNPNQVDASTNQTASTTDNVLYRMRTDTAGSNLTVTLPAPGAVSDGFQLCVQKYSGDFTYDVIIARNGAATINSVAADYVIRGSFKAIRFQKSGTNWGIQIFGIGIQHGLYQEDGGLDLLEGALFWNCAATSGLAAGHTFEVLMTDTEVESCTLARLLPDDYDGDGIVDLNDGKAPSEFPQISLTNNSASAVLNVTRCIASSIQKTGSPLATLIESDNDVSQTTADSTTQQLFMGEGEQPFSRMSQVWGVQHKTTGAAAGTGRGAISYGPATLRYDFLNKRVRIPGAPECTAPPVIELSGSTYQIDTDATFDKAGTKSYQWCCDHEPIAGQTGTTLTQANAPAGRITLRVTLLDATYGDCIAESNGLIEA